MHVSETAVTNIQHRGEALPQPWVAATRERGVGSDAGERQREDGGSEIGHREPSHGGIAQPLATAVKTISA